MSRPSKKSNLAAARARMYHELVFESAEKVFAEEGFDESSMQDLAAEAGISLKTLYATFPGKDDIYREILTVRGGGLAEAIRGAVKAEGSPLDRVRAGVRNIVSYLIEHRAFFRILLQEGQAWGLNPRGAEARQAWEVGIATVRAVIVEGIAAGEFLPCNPDLLAPTVNAVLQVQLAGLLERGEDPDPDPDAIADEILVTLGRMLCGQDAQRDSQAEVA